MIRDPLSRAISHYYHWKRSGFGAFSSLTLDDYLQRDSEHSYVRALTSNWMAFTLQINSNEEISEKLTRYKFIGLFEEIQKSCDMLADRLSKPRYLLPSKRKGKYTIDKIDNNTQRVFRQNNDLDFRIYEYAKKRFSAELIK